LINLSVSYSSWERNDGKLSILTKKITIKEKSTFIVNAIWEIAVVAYFIFSCQQNDFISYPDE